MSVYIGNVGSKAFKGPYNNRESKKFISNKATLVNALRYKHFKKKVYGICRWLSGRFGDQ